MALLGHSRVGRNVRSWWKPTLRACPAARAYGLGSAQQVGGPEPPETDPQPSRCDRQRAPKAGAYPTPAGLMPTARPMAAAGGQFLQNACTNRALLGYHYRCSDGWGRRLTG
jgi:hypothetical protein